MYFPKALSKVPRLHQLAIYESCGYWHLTWIGKIYYMEGIYYANFFFTNTAKIDAKITDYNKSDTVNVVMEACLISNVKVGDVFNNQGYYVKGSNSYLTRKDYLTLNINNKHSNVRHDLNFAIDSTYPFPTLSELEDFTYIKCELDMENKKVKVIIPTCVICSFLYFKNPFITDKILDNTLFEFLKIKKNPIVRINQQLKRGLLSYDDSIVLPEEIHSLAQFFFLKGNPGIRSINHISSRLRKKKLENTSGTYLSFLTPFKCNCSLEIYGSYFDQKGNTFFLAFGIAKMIPLKNNIFSIDELIIEAKSNLQNNYPLVLTNRTLKQYNAKSRNGIISQNSGKFYPHNNSNYFGLKTWINKFNFKNSEFEILNYYQTDKYEEESKWDCKYKVLFDKLLSESSIPYNYISFENIENSFSTKILVSGQFHFLSVIEINFRNHFFYKLDFGPNFNLFISESINCDKLSKLKIIMICEKMIKEFCYRDYEFKMISNEELNKYSKLYNISIYDFEPRGRTFKFHIFQTVEHIIYNLINIMEKSF